MSGALSVQLLTNDICNLALFMDFVRCWFEGVRARDLGCADRLSRAIPHETIILVDTYDDTLFLLKRILHPTGTLFSAPSIKWCRTVFLQLLLHLLESAVQLSVLLH